jgi:Outer membrane protein beta-barrel domain
LGSEADALEHVIRDLQMKIQYALLTMVLALACNKALPQEGPGMEVNVDYSYIHANPQNNHVIPTFSLNGGGGSVLMYFNDHVGLEAEFQGYGSYTHHFTVPPPYCNGPCQVSAQGNLFTYNGGPIVKFRTRHIEPFVETIFGGAHSNLYANVYSVCPNCVLASKSPSNNAFDFLVGGGVDLTFPGYRLAIRLAQFDYLLTRFGNDFTKGNNNQSNFRYQAGIQLRF